MISCLGLWAESQVSVQSIMLTPLSLGWEHNPRCTVNGEVQWRLLRGGPLACPPVVRCVFYVLPSLPACRRVRWACGCCTGWLAGRPPWAWQGTGACCCSWCAPADPSRLPQPCLWAGAWHASPSYPPQLVNVDSRIHNIKIHTVYYIHYIVYAYIGPGVFPDHVTWPVKTLVLKQGHMVSSRSFATHYTVVTCVCIYWDRGKPITEIEGSQSLK